MSASTMVPWVLSVGLGYRQTWMHFMKSQTLLTFGYSIIHLLTRLRASKIRRIHPSYWPSRLLRPKAVICGATWKALSSASHIKNIVWVKFKADLFSEEIKMLATVMYLQYVSFQFVCWNMGRNFLMRCFVTRVTGMWTDSQPCLCSQE